jgi:hypothetical protein
VMSGGTSVRPRWRNVSAVPSARGFGNIDGSSDPRASSAFESCVQRLDDAAAQRWGRAYCPDGHADRGESEEAM